MGRILNRSHGDRSLDMPPPRKIQDSGIIWGLHTGSDGVPRYTLTHEPSGSG